MRCTAAAVDERRLAARLLFVITNCVRPSPAPRKIDIEGAGTPVSRMGFGALKHDLVKRRAGNPLRELLTEDSGPLRDRSGVVSLAALARDHKNGSMPFPVRGEQKRNERRSPLCDRLAVEINPHIRLGLPPLHAREFPLVHANHCSAGIEHRGRGRRGLLADAKFRNLEDLPCVRLRQFLWKFLRDLFRSFLFERLGAACNTLPKTFLLGAQNARLSTHCRPASGALSVSASPPMIEERCAPHE